jgi:hypothetical protein
MWREWEERDGQWGRLPSEAHGTLTELHVAAERELALENGWKVEERKTVADVTNTLAHPCEPLLFLATRDGVVAVHDLATGTTRRMNAEHDLPVTVLAYSPNARQLATTDFGGNVMIWDVETCTRVRTLVGGRRDVAEAIWSPCGDFFATGSGRGLIRVYDVEKGTLRYRVQAGAAIESMVAHPDGEVFVTSVGRGHVQTWRWDSGELVGELPPPPFELPQFYSTSEVLIAVSIDGQIAARPWNVADGWKKLDLPPLWSCGGRGVALAHGLFVSVNQFGKLLSWRVTGPDPNAWTPVFLGAPVRVSPSANTAVPNPALAGPRLVIAPAFGDTLQLWTPPASPSTPAGLLC